MSLKLDLLAVVFLVGLDPSTQAHDIYSHLRDRFGAVVAMRRIVDRRLTG
ncbi:hypothetical protein [Microvirga ossetica]|nr:hypothetical protein [Microvirga ossetica]